MKNLIGNKIFLRALEPEDLEFVYAIENDESLWEMSNTETPYSKFLIEQYLKNSFQDIYQAKQLRLAIAKMNDFSAIGLIDLFEFDAMNKRAGVGIIVNETRNRNQGFGGEALQLMINYCFERLCLNQVFANVSVDNQPSLKLFTTFGFEKIGVKKQWNLVKGIYRDEVMFQLINLKGNESKEK